MQCAISAWLEKGMFMAAHTVSAFTGVFVPLSGVGERVDSTAVCLYTPPLPSEGFPCRRVLSVNYGAQGSPEP